MRVGIVGLGLIGGSLARDLSAAGHTVLGSDRRPAAVRGARRARAITGDLGARGEEISGCDAVVIAVPVDAALATLRGLAPHLAEVPLITDVGSTKASIMRAARQLGLSKSFVGSHPLAGDHASGWKASRRGLFRGATVYLTPGSRAGTAALRRARRLWLATGARPLVMPAAAHDDLLSATSHLPQVTALALAMLLGDARIPRSALGRGGRDMTRLAASNPEVWAAILTDNRKRVASRIARLRKALAQIAEKVAGGDARALRRMLVLTNDWARK